MADRNRLSGDIPCRTNDVIMVAGHLYYVRGIEPLYYRFRPAAGVFTSRIESVTDLTPSSDRIYYITGLGMESVNMECQLRYQAGNPRNTVNAQSNQRIPGTVCPADHPYPVRFSMQSGETMELDVNIVVGNIVNAFVMFNGWKIITQPYRCDEDVRVPKPIPIVLEDVRGLGL